MNEPLAQCDCCDYFTIPEGSDYEICPVCFWEQDYLGISEPHEASGANHGLSLPEGRKNFLKIGACSEQFVSNVLPTTKGKNFVMLFAPGSNIPVKSLRPSASTGTARKRAAPYLKR